MRRILNVTSVLTLASLLVPAAAAYCLTGVRLPATADVFYNPAGKITSGQCISASQMDSAVTSGISWKAIRYAGTTSSAANKRDGRNTVGWAKLGGGALGITNYLSNDR